MAIAKGTVSREVPVAPSFPSSPDGKVQLRTTKGGQFVLLPGVVGHDVARMHALGVPNPWGDGTIILSGNNAGLFMNALLLNNARLAKEDSGSAQA